MHILSHPTEYTTPKMFQSFTPLQNRNNKVPPIAECPIILKYVNKFYMDFKTFISGPS